MSRDPIANEPPLQVEARTDTTEMAYSTDTNRTHHPDPRSPTAPAIPPSSEGSVSRLAALGEVQPQILVSAIVSTYKSERFIAGCLEDLTAQSLFIQGRMEIVIIDSASPENEAAIIGEYRKRHRNIVYFRSPVRETLYAAWNRAIGLSKGRYITNANTDDRHRFDAIETMAAALESNPEVSLVYGNCYLSTVPNQTFAENPRTRQFIYPEFFAPAALLHFQFGPQPMWRKSVHKLIGYYDANMKGAGDYDFNLRLARKCLALHLPVVLGSYLAHSGAISFADNTLQMETQMVWNRYCNDKTIEALYSQAGVETPTAADKARVHLDLGNRAMSYIAPWGGGRLESNVALAGKCFMRSIELDPEAPAALNNLFCILAASGRTGEALELLKQHPSAKDHPTVTANLRRVNGGNFKGSLVLIPSGLNLPSQQQLAAWAPEQSLLAS